MNQEQLGSIIQRRRKTLALDQRSLAEIAGLSAHSVSDIESGKGNPTLAVLNQLATALGLDVQLVVRSTDYREKESLP